MNMMIIKIQIEKWHQSCLIQNKLCFHYVDSIMMKLVIIPW